MECPHCRLVNPTDAKRCDCGHEFGTPTTGSQMIGPTAGQWSPALFILPAAYVGFALAVQAEVLQWEGSWGWFFVFILGLPASILGMFAAYVVGPFIGFSVFGGIQWYWVSRGLREALREVRGWLRH